MSRLNKVNEYKEATSVFCGIDRRERIPDGFFSDMNNMTSSKYPCLATRAERADMVFNNSIIVKGEPCDVIENNGALAVICTNGAMRCFGREIDSIPEGKSIIRFGKKLFTLPTGVLVDEFSEKTAAAKLGEFFACEPRDSSGKAIEIIYGPKPTDPTGGQYWYNAETGGIYMYSEIDERWNPIVVLYCNMKLTDSEENYGQYSDFSKDDAIHISGVGESGDLDTFISGVSDIDGITVETDLPYPPGEEYIFIVERKFPALEFATVHNNRIWGCVFSSELNEIYASKLGDPLNWNSFRGISTDSYAVSVGEPGEFTGCETLGDTVIFFKEMCMYSVYGSEPSNFQVVKTDCFGVQKGSEKSVVKINGQIYYKSCHGIMRLAESTLPQLISEELGEDIWRDAVAGTDGNKYYVVMTDVSGQRNMFVFDTRTNLWHREDEPCEGLFKMLYYRNNLLCIGKRQTTLKGKDESFAFELVFSYISNELTCNEYLIEDDEIYAVKQDEGRFRWEAETGIRGLTLSEYKRLKGLDIRMKISSGARCNVLIEYDGRGNWENIGSFEDDGLNTFRIRDRLDRCDSYRLKFQGYGQIVIYNIIEIYEEAGNIGV